MSASLTPLAERVIGLALRQRKIVDFADLLAAGLPHSTITSWLRTGRLYRVHEGVYSIVPPQTLDREERWYAAVRASGPGAALSHGPAGQLGGFVDHRYRYALHVIVPDRCRRRIPGIVVHRPRLFAPRDTTEVGGIAVTTPTRTIWDMAMNHSPLQLRRAFEKAERLDKIDRARLEALTLSTPNRKGSGVIRQLLRDRPLPAADVRSWLEELLWETCIANGLPLPATNVPLLGYTVDFLWADARLVIEADGGDHLEPTQRDSDNARDFALQRADYLVRRYSSRDMTREAAVVGEVLSALNT